MLKGKYRNKPCPCGSGRKIKKCCGDPAAKLDRLMKRDPRTHEPGTYIKVNNG